ncbi:PhnB protein [Agrococcus sp. UYP33]
MSTTTTIHLNRRGDARAVLEFYQRVLQGELTLATYADLGMPRDLADADRIVFGQVDADGSRLMAYDIPGAVGGAAPAGETRREHGTTITSEPFFVSLSGETLDEVAALWERLADGAAVIEPLAASAWSPGFGMLTDRFGVTWTIGVSPARSEAPGA